MKKTIITLLLLLSPYIAQANTLAIPPAAFKTTGCNDTYPITKTGRIGNGACYAYANINLPDASVITDVNVKFLGLDSTCTLQAELRSVDLEGHNTLIANNTANGLTTGVESIVLNGTTVDASQGYYVAMRVWNSNRCYLYGVEVVY